MTKQLVEIGNRLFLDMVTFLRYFASSFFSASIIWIADADHNLVEVSSDNYNILSVAGGKMPTFDLFAFLSIIGIATYRFHRATIMRIILMPLFHKLTVKDKSITIDDLSFARWIHRAKVGDNGSSCEASAVQQHLDHANASGDFLYCTCWLTLTFLCIGHFCFADKLDISKMHLYGISIFVILFLVAGLINQYYMATLDYKAYLRYRKS